MENKQWTVEEKELRPMSGWLFLLLGVILIAGGVVLCCMTGMYDEEEVSLLFCIAGVVLILLGLVGLLGLKVLHPNEAIVLTLFGKYHGSIKKDGFFWVNPFCSTFNPAAGTTAGVGRKISLKAMTLNNEKQKVNDEEGNPIEIGVVVIWRVVNTARAVFHVENYATYISTQCDAAIRQVARQYPYDVSENGENRCADPPSRSPRSSAKRSRAASSSRGSKLRKRASPIWPMPRRSPRPCCSGSRRPRSSRRGRRSSTARSAWWRWH